MKVSDEHLDCLLKFLVDLEINKTKQSETESVQGNNLLELSLFDECYILENIEKEREFSFRVDMNSQLFIKLENLNKVKNDDSLDFFIGSQKVIINNKSHYLFFKEVNILFKNNCFFVESKNDFIRINPVIWSYLNFDKEIVKSFVKKVEENNFSLMQPLGCYMLNELFRKLLEEENLYKQYFELNIQDKKGFVLLDSQMFKLNKG